MEGAEPSQGEPCSSETSSSSFDDVELGNTPLVGGDCQQVGSGQTSLPDMAWPDPLLCAPLFCSCPVGGRPEREVRAVERAPELAAAAAAAAP